MRSAANLCRRAKRARARGRRCGGPVLRACCALRQAHSARASGGRGRGARARALRLRGRRGREREARATHAAHVPCRCRCRRHAVAAEGRSRRLHAPCIGAAGRRRASAPIGSPAARPAGRAAGPPAAPPPGRAWRSRLYWSWGLSCLCFWLRAHSSLAVMATPASQWEAAPLCVFLSAVPPES